MTRIKPALFDVRSFVRDFAGVLIACVALLVSIVTLYLNYRVVDDLRFTIGSDIPIPNPKSSSNPLIIYTPHSLTFINAGNRSVAILSVRMAIYQSITVKPVADTCPRDVSRTIRIALDPFVIKAAEVVVKPVALDAELEHDVEGHSIVELNPKMLRVVSCMVFDLVTPDNVPSTISIPITSSEFTTPPFGTTDTFFEEGKPIKLFPR